MEGNLKLATFYQSVGKPIGGARIQIAAMENPNQVIDEVYTDESGQSLDVTLPAPPLEYSMQPGAPQPYSLYDVRVQAEGFEDVEIKGVQVLPQQQALQNVMLLPKTISQRQGLVIPPHTLNGVFPPKIPESPVKELPPVTGLVVLPEPVIPEYIVVHAGVPTNTAAPKYWVPFKEYIKNVASSEIYATWPDETLKANILAILSFTLNRVFTEWYRGKGYNFTITNSTQFDQAFTYGRNIFADISRVVDEIFVNYITMPHIRQPLFAQYCDGRRVQCPGWMSQWGAKDLGDRGYTAMDIVKHYYGQEAYLAQAKKVEGVPMSWAGETLQVGSKGESVRVIQEQLNAISNNFPAIQKLKVDGLYGENTRQSVEKFQGLFNMSTTGMVDMATWYRISSIYVAVQNLAALT